MNRTALTLFLVILGACTVTNQSGDGTSSSTFEGNVKYSKWFTPERMRLDFVMAGDKDCQYAFLDKVYRECEWSGSPNSLIDKSGYGQYYIEVFSLDSLVYSRGFSSLFEEWRSTDQATKVAMAASQTLWIPYPKLPIDVVLYHRNPHTGRFEKYFSCPIDPTDTHIIPAEENDFRVLPLMVNGESSHKVDLVIAGDAYKAGQMQKLRADATRMMEYLFTLEPYAHRRSDFNVWLVESVSKDDGVDIPNHGQWRRTAMDSSFDTFYEDRYLTIMDHSKIADAVSAAQFDAIFVLANETKYGGGGIYNSYAMGTSDNPRSEMVFAHELGHSIAGLGDEYYDTDVQYNDMYPAGVEPWEPNITNLTNFSSKWEDMIGDGVPVPTPADSSLYYGTVGVFEGAAYMSKGCYRPFIECRMLNNTAPGFCPVCQRAIERMIDYYVK